MGLRQYFQRYVGQIISDPHDENAHDKDADPIIHDIRKKARERGLLAIFKKPDSDGLYGTALSVNIMLTKEGVPDDQKENGWKIELISSDLD